jgi:hypothetical protein
MQRPFQVNITNISEVRMGSPYSTCEIELIGFDKVSIAKNGWQDKYAWSRDSSKLVLIKLDFENNIPAFHFFIINVDTGETKESNKYFGLVNEISIEDNTIVINKFIYDKLKSKPGKVCCEVDEKFEIF